MTSLGYHIHLGPQPAIKLLTMNLTVETRIITCPEDPDIIRLHDFGMEDPVPFIVMSYTPNSSLCKLHSRGNYLSLQTIVTSSKRIATTLRSDHDQKPIHHNIISEGPLMVFWDPAQSLWHRSDRTEVMLLRHQEGHWSDDPYGARAALRQAPVLGSRWQKAKVALFEPWCLVLPWIPSQSRWWNIPWPMVRRNNAIPEHL